MTYAIYIITCTVNAKQYVGITKDLARRWKEHGSMNGSSRALHNAMKKYGKEAFVFTHIADAFDKDAACDLERMLIKEKNTLVPNGYNLTSGGEGSFEPSEELRIMRRNSRLGKKMSQATKDKLSALRSGKPMHPAVKEILLKANLGKRLSEETKAKMSIAKKGKPPNSAGKPRSAEAIEKQRASIIATLAAKRAIKNAQKESV